jgi:NADPH-dependent ferric siderophore reductase
MHVLYVGDSADIPAIRQRLAELPSDAYGQVYLEVATRIQIQRWATPPGVSVTWLCRDRTSSVLGHLVPRGERAVRAASAWIAEWMPEQAGEGVPEIQMWIGCAASARVDRLYRALRTRLDAS